MLKTLKLFFGNKEANPYLVVLCLLLASISETLGIGTLLPVIAMAAGSTSAGSSAVAQYAETALSWVGLDLSFGALVFMVAVFVILSAVLTYSALAYAARAGARVATALRGRLLAAVFNARWGYFSDKKSGGISNLIGGEAGKAGEYYVVAANVVSSVIGAVAFAVIALFMNWQLALAAAAFGLVMTLGLERFVRQARKASYRQTDRTTALLSDMVDAIANIKPLKTMHRYGPILAGVDRTFQKLRKAAIRRELAKAGLAQSGTATFAVVACAGLYVAHVLLAVPFPDLLVSALILNKVVSAVSKAQRLNQMATLLESSQVRTMELITEAEASREVNDGRKSPEIAQGCRFENVDFFHGDIQILRGVSLDIPGNAITVLSGPSGAGKTTIIDLLIGLHRPATGRILIGGTPIEDVDIVKWRKQVGYVPQELSLFHSTVRMNLTLGDETITDADVMAALDKAGATAFVAAMPLGLDTDVGEMGTKLSGGQRQRISLARALVGNPKILVLDEVTSALDPDTEAGIVDNIAGLRGGYTIVAITHRPAWTRIADRLYRVAEGRVTEDVEREALAAGPA
jgi:ATP-binding cassette, subfamily C, bacterial